MLIPQRLPQIRSFFTSLRAARQRGQAAVEMALILPILLILVFGIAASGFVFYAYIQVSNASREGSRAGSLYRTIMVSSGLTLDQTVQKAVYDDKGTTTPNDDLSALGGLPVTSSNPAVVVTYSSTKGGSKTDPRSGDIVTAIVTYSYTQPILSAFGSIFPQPLVIQRSVMMEMQ